MEIVGNAASLERTFSHASRSATTFNRDLSRSTRGALAGSGVFRGLGRSIAFASGGFLAFGGAAAVLRKSIEGAEQAEKAQKALATAIQKTGGNAKTLLPTIDAWAQTQTKFGVSAADAETGLGRLVELTGSTSKAMKGYTAALEISKATGKGFNAVSLAVGKALDGQSTALARYIGQVKKGTTNAQLLALINQKFGGQAAANTTEIDRFNAELANTEEILGKAILPTLNKYLASGSKWLDQTNRSGKLQADVAAASRGFASAIRDAAGVVKTVDRVTGSFKNTLELLLALKVASAVGGWSGAFRTLSKEEKAAGGRAALLKGNLAALAEIGTIAIGVDVIFHAKGVNKFLRDHVPGLGAIQDFEDKHNPVAHFLNTHAPNVGVNPSTSLPVDVSVGSGAGQHAALIVNAAKKASAQAKADAAAITAASKTPGLTATQRNTFFDNAIARILLRGGLGTIQQQIAALQKADSLISARLKATKDVTRKLNLEDQLLQNAAQIKSLTTEAAQEALQKRQASAAAKQQAKQAQTAALAAKQFRQLGLSATGDAITPGVANLTKRLGQLTANVTASSLNTPKLQSELTRFRKVLSEGLVPKDVRAKIKDMMDGIADQVKTSAPATKFKHVNATAFVKGLGINLTPAERRKLTFAVSAIGPGGTVPGVRSQAFAKAGGQPIVLHSVVHLDGREVGRSVTRHQVKEPKRQPSRRG